MRLSSTDGELGVRIYSLLLCDAVLTAGVDAGCVNCWSTVDVLLALPTELRDVRPDNDD